VTIVRKHVFLPEVEEFRGSKTATPELIRQLDAVMKSVMMVVLFHKQ
jgi:hypothetical protein